MSYFETNKYFFLFQGKPDQQLHLGKPDFSKVVKSTGYVDKSLLIKEVFRHNFIIVSAPTKFGKSTNMDMFKKFVEIVVDKNGEPITNLDNGTTGIFIEKSQEQLTKNYKLFKKHNLNIYQDRQFVYKHCGKHPVLFVSFKQIEGNHFEEILENSKIVLEKAFIQHKYLLKCKKLWSIEKSEKQTFIEYLKSSEHENMNETHLILGFKFLSKILHQHFNKPVFVLIDDYDAPFFDAIFNFNSEIDKTVNFITNLISQLINKNPDVERCLINSRLQFSKSKFTNVESFPFLNNHNFVEFYGLTANELEDVVKVFNKFNKLKEIEEYYDGYNVIGRDVKIYNIWSVLNYLKYGLRESYWAEIGGIEEFNNVLSSFEILAKIEQLLNGEEITIEKFTKIDSEKILLLNRLINKPSFIGAVGQDSTISDLLIQFLFEVGYLKITQTIPIKLKIPNIEIGNELADNLYTVSYFKEKYKFNSLKISAVNEAIKYLSFENDTDTFLRFTKSVADLFSNKTVPLPNNDYDFHRALLTFAKIKGNFELVIGENNFIRGKKLDIVIIRLDGTTIILQVMYEEQSAYDGLKQILSRSYDEIIRKEYTIFNKGHNICIGLHLSENREVNVSYLVNSLDINGATNLTSF